MNEPTAPSPVAAPEPAVASPAVPAPAPGPVPAGPNWRWVGGVGLLVLVVGCLVLVWSTQQRVRSLEQELVRRQQSSQEQSTEARLLAKQSHDSSTQLAAKMALLEARVAETALQRSQVEELIQSLSRSRDENVVADVEAALRVAQQQSAITGSLEPMVAVLRQADERLARYEQPRLERVRRAVAKDLDKVRAANVADLPSLSVRLDELIRTVDELPLLSEPMRRAAPEPARAAASAPAVAKAASPGPAPDLSWWGTLALGSQRVMADIWQEARSLVRVTRIDHPEAMLLTPEQSFFVRENLKLRLLNARLALLSRQFDVVQSDLAQARASLDRYFDRNTRRVAAASEQMAAIAAQSRQVPLPRADESLAALAAAAAGR
ncbi:uroporphyrinogen-III C-methyltransferase [Ideonella paludis]|uniref:Uroporphyrinogen-III C-methyltransferase n=1 Tax=Ideonella paludis TaxID=1233411 RepID=A0ABS5E0Z9_9BURK|nr:uroporphyrinogen-III C-methyltransferase [Ideonella paludis]MBQ0937078.1 uroporphyrinogen-III C-methyltransferase [Ideonella paludis]